MNYKYPWHEVNWDLPTADIADIWIGASDRWCLTHVSKMRERPAKWRRGGTKTLGDNEYWRTLDDEHIRARDWRTSHEARLHAARS